MKRLTVSVPDDVHRAAQVLAAKRGMSLSRLVADYLCSISDYDAEFARLQARQADRARDRGARR